MKETASVVISKWSARCIEKELYMSSIFQIFNGFRILHIMFDGDAFDTTTTFLKTSSWQRKISYLLCPVFPPNFDIYPCYRSRTNM